MLANWERAAKISSKQQQQASRESGDRYFELCKERVFRRSYRLLLFLLMAKEEENKITN
ncbi:hypothetical protein [Gloeothece verrucosa]|uniref:Uncharacterized protein n=1 Tax=Gloeothece verrucosa (strain PCC 7822) TaxID=497965 RepID=E0UE27_GLOV7|nr:hypothetical protein [Gloeothece verrucosa]ADN13031.1 hypothetical protein Cyan7822_1021 [Gloeothece verrucosa PCC 7822]